MYKNAINSNKQR